MRNKGARSPWGLACFPRPQVSNFCLGGATTATLTLAITAVPSILYSVILFAICMICQYQLIFMGVHLEVQSGWNIFMAIHGRRCAQHESSDPMHGYKWTQCAEKRRHSDHIASGPQI